MTENNPTGRAVDPFVLNPWRRVVALAVDIPLVVGATMGVLTLIMGTYVSDNPWPAYITMTTIGALYEGITGTCSRQGTLGKMLFRTVVVRIDQGRISFLQGMARGAIKWASLPIWMIYFFFLMTPSSLVPSPKITTLHDVFSLTRVKARNARPMRSPDQGVQATR